MALLRERIQLKKRSVRTEPRGEVMVRLKRKGSQHRRTAQGGRRKRRPVLFLYQREECVSRKK